jgi:hypothetical protein
MNGSNGLRVLDIGCAPGAMRGAKDVFADVRGRVVYLEDVLSPTTDEWDAT